MNIVKLRKASSGAIKIDNAESVMSALRLEIYNYSAKEVAALCDVSVSCIYAIRRGTTRWPRDTTLFRLARAMGFTFYMVKS